MRDDVKHFGTRYIATERSSKVTFQPSSLTGTNVVTVFHPGSITNRLPGRVVTICSVMSNLHSEYLFTLTPATPDDSSAALCGGEESSSSSSL